MVEHSLTISVPKTVNQLLRMTQQKLDGRSKLTKQQACTYSQRKRNLLIEIASGWIGGGAGICVTHPIDSVRVTKQYQARISGNECSYYQILKQIKATHGVSGFYRGVIPPTVLRGGGLAANRAGYYLGMQLFDEGVNVKGTWRIWVVGAFAGFFNAIADMPIQLIKCRAQVKAGLTKETFKLHAETLKSIWKFEGWSAFTNGAVPCITINVFSYGLFYCLYEQMVMNEVPAFAAGMTAGVISWPLFLPLDTLRVRMQCQPYYVRLSVVSGEMLRQPVNQWFAGLGATLLRAGIRFGVTMMAVEQCNKAFKRAF